MSHKTDKKRKRRSFWEPESENVTKWLDAQTDLGTSLQLIVIDAIRKYGEGDAIKAHLSQREQAAFDWERQPPISAPQTAPAPVAETPAPPRIAPEPEPEPELMVDFEGDLDVSEVIAPEPEPEIDSDELDFDVGGVIRGVAEGNDPAAAADLDEDEDDYDPLSIMMNDIGSSISK